MVWLTNQLKVGALFALVGVTVLICVLTVFGAIILEARERMIQETQAAMIELLQKPPVDLLDGETLLEKALTYELSEKDSDVLFQLGD